MQVLYKYLVLIIGVWLPLESVIGICQHEEQCQWQSREPLWGREKRKISLKHGPVLTDQKRSSGGRCECVSDYSLQKTSQTPLPKLPIKPAEWKKGLVDRWDQDRQTIRVMMKHGGWGVTVQFGQIWLPQVQGHLPCKLTADSSRMNSEVYRSVLSAQVR